MVYYTNESNCNLLYKAHGHLLTFRPQSDKTDKFLLTKTLKFQNPKISFIATIRSGFINLFVMLSDSETTHRQAAKLLFLAFLLLAIKVLRYRSG